MTTNVGNLLHLEFLRFALWLTDHCYLSTEFFHLNSVPMNSAYYTSKSFFSTLPLFLVTLVMNCSSLRHLSVNCLQDCHHDYRVIRNIVVGFLNDISFVGIRSLNCLAMNEVIFFHCRECTLNACMLTYIHVHCIIKICTIIML